MGLGKRKFGLGKRKFGLGKRKFGPGGAQANKKFRKFNPKEDRGKGKQAMPWQEIKPCN